MYSVGLVGLPNAGKSMLFNALTQGKAQVANYPFCTISPNVGVAPIPDSRLWKLAGLVNPERVHPATVELVDIAGLVRGAHQGEGLGNEFLGHIRASAALVHVVRCFQNEEVSAPEGDIDPVRDLEVASTELALSDLQVLERRLTKYRKALKSGDKEAEAHLAVLERFQGLLDSGNPCAGLSLRELSWLAEEGFLTVRPSLVVANIGEEMVGSPDASLNGLQEQAERCGLDVVQMCVQLEWELGQLSETEAREFKQELGLTEDGAACLLRATNKLLDLVTFYTIVGGNEVRAWTLPRGTPAGEAAGKVHSDMARGFIRAEVVTYDELMSAGSLASARARGVVASEGRDYPVQDGDVITFRFQR